MWYKRVCTEQMHAGVPVMISRYVEQARRCLCKWPSCSVGGGLAQGQPLMIVLVGERTSTV